MVLVTGGFARRVFRRLGREVGSWPPLMRIGLGVFAVGGSADVAYHAGVQIGWGIPAAAAFWAHLITLVGMVVTMLGVLTGGRWKRRTQEPFSPGLSLRIPKEV